MKRLEYFFDYVSPFSYLADTQVAALHKKTGAEVVFRPMLLGAVMNATGNRPPAEVAAKGKYMFADLERWAKRYGVPFQFNPFFPQSTIPALRGALVALEDGGFEAYHAAIFNGMWRDGLQLSDAAVLKGAIAKAGLDAEKIASRIGEQAIKDKLRTNTDEAVERGAFGAPTFFVGDQMFWGNDRLEFVEEALR